MERFACKTVVVSGPDALDSLRDFDSKKMLIVTDAALRHSRQLHQILRAAGNPESEVLEMQCPDAPMKQAVEGSRQIKALRPDTVVALGDSSVLECSKAMVGFSGHPCAFAVVPTAFGSGTEVTDRVTLTHNGQIHLLQSRDMCPGLTVLDSSLLGITVKADIAEHGFELLGAALEAYTGKKSGFLSALHAREAFAAGFGALPAAFAGNQTALGRMQMASVLTGFAVKEAGMGLCRAMAHSLQAVFGLSLGRSTAILLPAVVGCNVHAAGKQYAELSRGAGMGGSSEGIGARNLRTGLIRLRRELALPGTLVQAGVDIRSIWNNGRQIVALTLEDPECRNNPVTVDDFVVRRLLDEITGRI